MANSNTFSNVILVSLFITNSLQINLAVKLTSSQSMTLSSKH